jgi:hypothetical protein
MDKTIIKLVVAMTIIVAYPSYAVDYERCSKLLDRYNKAVNAIGKAEVKHEMRIKIPLNVCMNESTEEKKDNCENTFRELYKSRTQKPKEWVVDESDKKNKIPLYTSEGSYWFKIFKDIISDQKYYKCPK